MLYYFPLEGTALSPQGHHGQSYLCSFLTGRDTGVEDQEADTSLPLITPLPLPKFPSSSLMPDVQVQG